VSPEGALASAARRQRVLDLALVAGLVVVLLLIAANTRLAYLNTQRLYQASQEANHSRQVLAALRDLLSLMKDAETGQRGFLLTGDEAYLEPYERAVRIVPAGLAALDRLTHTDPAVQQRLPAIERTIAAKMAELAETVRLRRETGLAAAELVVRSGAGLRRMDELRTLLGEIERDEQLGLAARTLVAQRSRDGAVTSGLFSGVAGLMVALGFGLGLRRYLRVQREGADAVFEQKELFRTTLASIGDAVITTDTGGRVTFLNEVARTLTGWTPEDASGQALSAVFRIVNEDTRAEVENPALRALREGAIVGLANHTILLARDGQEHPIDDSAAPIRHRERGVQGSVLVFRDISERRRTEAALLAADRRKDEFLAVLAHELRNPLAPLRNALHLLRLSHPDGATVARVREMMERQLQQMVRLIDDLMDVSRITSDKLELRRERVELRAVLESALETIEPVLRQSGHEVLVSLPPEPVFLFADSMRLAQAFYNLLNNACRYTEAGGRIALTARADGPQVVVSVADAGIGIHASMLDRVFGMFEQADHSGRARQGLGVGLTLVKRIVEMHGGTVDARSEGEGRGSEFVVRLAAAGDGDGARPEASAQAAGPRPAPRRRVLVADDNEDSAETMAMLLQALGHEVCIAHDGAQALEQARAFRPDVALLDIGMPRVDGYEAARRLRAEEWGRALVLVALTGWGQDEDRRRSEEAGFDRHLIKPVDIDALQEVLRTAGGSGE